MPTWKNCRSWGADLAVYLPIAKRQAEIMMRIAFLMDDRPKGSSCGTPTKWHCHVRFWPLADLQTAAQNVRSWRKSGRRVYEYTAQ